MSTPSGEQYPIQAGDYRAVVTECGATLRHLSCAGRDLVQGHQEDQMCSGGRGQLLMPWPNRIRDGAWSFAGKALQLPLSEPSRHNASHGLVRWASWQPLAPSTPSPSTPSPAAPAEPAAVVTLTYRLMAQPGYPWTLDLTARYALTEAGLTVTMGAVNRSSSAAPFACGAHPYLSTGSTLVDDNRLVLPGSVRLLSDDERKLPTGREDVAGTPYDFREGRALAGTVLDHAFTGLTRAPDGRARVTLRSPGGTGVELWADEHFGWLQAYTADDQGDRARSALAVEPTTAPPDAFNSAEDLVVLEPGEAFEASWGIRALGRFP